MEPMRICSCCGNPVRPAENAGSEDFPLCDSCYTLHYNRCVRCGTLILENHVCYYSPDDSEELPYCAACYHTIRGKEIHDYYYKPTPRFYGEPPRYYGVELEIDCALHLSDGELQQMSWSTFVSGCQAPALVQYLKEQRRTLHPQAPSAGAPHALSYPRRCGGRHGAHSDGHPGQRPEEPEQPPLVGPGGEAQFAMAHNGVLWNDRKLRRELALPGTKIETDSFVAVQLLEQCGALARAGLAGGEEISLACG